MWRIVPLGVVIVFVFSVGKACNHTMELQRISEQKSNKLVIELRKHHTLYKLRSKHVKNGYSGSYFLFVGGFSGGEEVRKVSFAWEFEGVYHFTTVPLETLVVKIDNNIKIPTIQFYTDPYSVNFYRERKTIGKWLTNHPYRINRIILTCTESQWTPDYHIKLMGGE